MDNKTIRERTKQKSKTKEKSLLLPLADSKATINVKNLSKTLKNVLPNDVKTRIAYIGQKLSSRCQIKDKIKKKHKYNLIYYAKYPEPSCTENYLGAIGHRIIEQTVDNAGIDKQSHLLKHALTQNH